MLGAVSICVDYLDRISSPMENEAIPVRFPVQGRRTEKAGKGEGGLIVSNSVIEGYNWTKHRKGDFGII